MKTKSKLKNHSKEVKELKEGKETKTSKISGKTTKQSTKSYLNDNINLTVYHSDIFILKFEKQTQMAGPKLGINFIEHLLKNNVLQRYPEYKLLEMYYMTLSAYNLAFTDLNKSAKFANFNFNKAYFECFLKNVLDHIKASSLEYIMLGIVMSFKKKIQSIICHAYIYNINLNMILMSHDQNLIKKNKRRNKKDPLLQENVDLFKGGNNNENNDNNIQLNNENIQINDFQAEHIETAMNEMKSFVKDNNSNVNDSQFRSRNLDNKSSLRFFLESKHENIQDQIEKLKLFSSINNSKQVAVKKLLYDDNIYLPEITVTDKNYKKNIINFIECRIMELDINLAKENYAYNQYKSFLAKYKEYYGISLNISSNNMVEYLLDEKNEIKLINRIEEKDDFFENIETFRDTLNQEAVITQLEIDDNCMLNNYDVSPGKFHNMSKLKALFFNEFDEIKKNEKGNFNLLTKIKEVTKEVNKVIDDDNVSSTNKRIVFCFTIFLNYIDKHDIFVKQEKLYGDVTLVL